MPRGAPLRRSMRPGKKIKPAASPRHPMCVHFYTDILPPTLDWDQVTDRICDFLDSTLRDTNTDGFVLGLSGGVDSAAVAHLAAKRHADKTQAVLMPDSGATPDSETDDGKLVAESLNIKCDTVPLDGIIKGYVEALGGGRRVVGNLRARVRAAILYHYANSNNLLVLGSTDHSEYLLGYYTKFGDGAADAVPITSLYKTQVRSLAEHLGVPQHIVEKKSSPHLWPGQDAETELGATYETIDRTLYGIRRLGLSAKDCARRASVPVDTVNRILDMVKKNRHKTEEPLRPPDK